MAATLTPAEKEARTRLALAAIASWGAPLCGGGSHAERNFDAPDLMPDDAAHLASERDFGDALNTLDSRKWDP